MDNSYKNSNEIEALKFSDLIRVIKRYRYSIIFIAILGSLISVALIYYKSNNYKAQATIEISSNLKQSSMQDILESSILGSSTSDVDTQKALIKSRMIILEVMKQVDLTTHIWVVNKFYKKRELYLDAPFSINIIKGKGIKFKLTPIDNKFYILEFTKKKDNGTVFKRKYQFNKLAKSKYFELIVNKLDGLLLDKYYEFIIYNSKSYAELLRKSNIEVTQLEEKANILGVSYTDSIALRAKDFVNTLVSVYMKKNIEYKSKQASKILEFINKQLAIISSNLKKSEKNIENFKTKQKTVDIKLSSTQISKSLSEYENKMAILDMQISILKSIYYKIKKGVGLDTLTIVGLDLDTSGITSLINELQQSLLKRKALLKDYTPIHPEVQKVSTRIINLKRIIKQSVYNFLTELKVKKSFLTKQMSKYQQKLQKLPKAQQNYLTLERKFIFNSKFYNYLLEKKTEAEIKKAANVNQNRIIDLAILPEKISSKKIILSSILGFVEGLLVGIILAFIRSFFDKTVKYEDDILRYTKAPILAAIPKLKKLSMDSLILSNKSKSLSMESFRVLRANIESITSKNNLKVITITSTKEDEGKTFVASNLALSLQMLDKRIIILDLNFRKPKLHRLFQVSNDIGLVKYLLGNATFDKVLQHTKSENLDIITTELKPSNPSELLNSYRLTELIERLKEHYEYIILDTSAIGEYTDTRTLLKLSDFVMYIIKANYTRKEHITLINNIYKKPYIKHFGIVFNGTKINSDTYEKIHGYYI